MIRNDYEKYNIDDWIFLLMFYYNLWKHSARETTLGNITTCTYTVCFFTENREKVIMIWYQEPDISVMGVFMDGTWKENLSGSYIICYWGPDIAVNEGVNGWDLKM